MSNVAYIFLDEGGNFDFSTNGTKFFTLTSILKYRPFKTYTELTELRYDLIETGIDLEYFHASEDRQPVRNQVFDIIEKHKDRLQVDSLLVEKKHTPEDKRDDKHFYPKMLSCLLKGVIGSLDKAISEVIVITDRIPVQKKRKAVEKAIKMELKKELSEGIQYRVFHHDSKSSSGLQIADYCNWALFRKWERADERSYERIMSMIKSEVEYYEGEELCA